MRLLSTVLALLVLSLTLFAACGGDDQASPGKPVPAGTGDFTRVTPKELEEALESGDFPLVNVHIPYEGELAGTDGFVAFDEISERLNDLPADKSARIVLYCQTGRMSTEAAQELVKLGYTNVWELGGGMLEWEKSGRQVQGRNK